MKLNSTLEKKLLKYSAMASGVVAIASSANAQITYFDEDPDVVITGHQQGLIWDFDGDTQNDMGVVMFDGTKSGTSVSGYQYVWYYKAAVALPYSGGAAMVDGAGDADALNANDAINSLGNFDSGSQVLMGTAGSVYWVGYGLYSSSGGPWIGATDKYLGLRFTSVGDIHYGWMRMDLTSDAVTVTIKDWAYNNVIEGPILAGQMTVGVAENAGELALIRYNNNRLDINVVKGTAGNLSVVNMVGKVVYTKGLNNSMESVDLSNLSAGLYIVNAEFAEGGVQHKIVIR